MTNKQVFSGYSGLVCAVVLTVAVLVQNVQAQEDILDWRICKIEVANKAEKLKMVTDCAEKHKFPLMLNLTLDAIKTEVQSIKDKDFDDGCFSKCLFENSHMLEADGKVATAKMADFYKGSNIKEEVFNEIKTMFEDCVKQEETKFKDEKELPCKMYTMIEICVFTKALDNKKLEEICKP